MKTVSSFFKTLYDLRKNGNITVFSKLHTVSKTDIAEVNAFLQAEFELERMEFPEAVDFDPVSALWAAKTIFYSAQLLLIRGDTLKDLAAFFPENNSKVTLTAILSADLSLRFLPEIYTQLQIADSKDPLLPLLERYLKQFHYSAIGSDIEPDVTDWPAELADPVYRKCYLDRIVEKKDYKRAEIPYINQLLHAAFGLYKNQFWPALKTINQE